MILSLNKHVSKCYVQADAQIALGSERKGEEKSSGFEGAARQAAYLEQKRKQPSLPELVRVMFEDD